MASGNWWTASLASTSGRTTANRVTEAYAIAASGGSAGAELEKVCADNELVIETWSPIHLRARLQELYWTNGREAVGAKQFWEDSLRYLYMPRLRSRTVLEEVVRKGTASRDFFGTAYGRDGAKYEGFQLGGGGVGFDDTLLLIEPSVAAAYAAAEATSRPTAATSDGGGTDGSGPKPSTDAPDGDASPGSEAPTPRYRVFRGAVTVNATLAKSHLNTIAEEVISLLTSDPHASVKVTLEIAAEFDRGVEDGTKRSVSENANNLGFTTREWE